MKHDWALMDCRCRKPECEYVGCTVCDKSKTSLNINEECKGA